MVHPKYRVRFLIPDPGSFRLCQTPQQFLCFKAYVKSKPLCVCVCECHSVCVTVCVCVCVCGCVCVFKLVHLEVASASASVMIPVRDIGLAEW